MNWKALLWGLVVQSLPHAVSRRMQTSYYLRKLCTFDNGREPDLLVVRRLVKIGDVGPILRQLLTRAEGFFGGLFFLTLSDELTRRVVSIIFRTLIQR